MIKDYNDIWWLYEKYSDIEWKITNDKKSWKELLDRIRRLSKMSDMEKRIEYARMSRRWNIKLEETERKMEEERKKYEEYNKRQNRITMIKTFFIMTIMFGICAVFYFYLISLNLF